MVAAPCTASLPKFCRSVNYLAANLRIQWKKEKKESAGKAAALKAEPEKKTDNIDPAVKDILKGYDEKLKQLEKCLDEVNNDVMTAMADLQNFSDFRTKLKQLKSEVTDKIDEVVRDFDESQNFLEAKINELADDMANDDGHQPKAKRKKKGKGKGKEKEKEERHDDSWLNMQEFRAFAEAQERAGLNLEESRALAKARENARELYPNLRWHS